MHGSGTVFFGNCNLGCIFCQNYAISHLGEGSEISHEKLAEIMLSLQAAGCHNINLVTPTHQVPAIMRALRSAAEGGLCIPIVYNCGVAARGDAESARACAGHDPQGPARSRELISYGIPAYKLNGRTVLYFAGWTHHYALYPSTAGVVAAFKDDLARYEVSKGTIRFPLSEPVPVKLIAAIARFRAQEAAATGSERRKKSRG